MSNLMNQARLKVLKARDDMIVVSCTQPHTTCIMLHARKGNSSFQDISDIICSTYFFICIFVTLYSACTHPPHQCRSSWLMYNVLCSPGQSLTLSCLRVELVHTLKQGWLILQWYSCLHVLNYYCYSPVSYLEDCFVECMFRYSVKRIFHKHCGQSTCFDNGRLTHSHWPNGGMMWTMQC